eukprot:Gb_30673 [translate_table: standard]
MASKVCLNAICGNTITNRRRSGWVLRSGQIADLCDTCGSAYEQMIFCETFHSDDAGWRPCNTCKKRVHCGCIVSIYSFVLLDTGGVECINCARNNTPTLASHQIQQFASFPSQRLIGLPVRSLSESIDVQLSLNTDPGQQQQVPYLWQSLTGQGKVSSWRQIPSVERSSDTNQLTENNGCEQTSGSHLSKMNENVLDKNKHLDLDDHEDSGRSTSIPEIMEDMNDSNSGRTEIEQKNVAMEKGNTESFPDSNLLTGLTHFVVNMKGGEEHIGLYTLNDSGADNDTLGAPAGTCLNISLGSVTPNNAVEASNNPATPTLGLPVSSGSPGEETEHTKVAAAPQHQGDHQILLRPPHASPSTGSELSKGILPQKRVARPPTEGGGQNQLLPWYWPRITDPELQQIYGDSKSSIIPLFEKVLSASDAGRIGRLVLPKACAEAYFPSISQPEGLPLKIQDAKGKDWVFQFRFWPNNNSRMYVLEGVTPCIQSMQLQAGDTVTFSRLDPEGKLVMGFRKPSNFASAQEGQPSTKGNGIFSNGNFNSGSIENLSTSSGFTGLLFQSMKGNEELHMNALTDQLNSLNTNLTWYKADEAGEKSKENSIIQSLPLPDKKSSCNLGSKSKRLRIDNEDALELKLTWEEAQDLLRPPPMIVPSIVMIEDHEFEEYEEPPVFGKSTIFTKKQSGEQDQWAQCDDCCSWRRLPMDAILPQRWTCVDNTWDTKRASCSAPQEVSFEELEDLLRLTIDSKKQEAAKGQKVIETSSALDTLANAAVLGVNVNRSPSPAQTTKHPRHRPGCTCIVCIQPPSGKGPKHKPTCTCNVCMTVKRRFKTLMMRRKKRQSEQEAANARTKHTWVKDDGEVTSRSKCPSDKYRLPVNSSVPGNRSQFSEGIMRISNNSGNGIRLLSDLNFKGHYRGSRGTEDSSVSKGQIDLNTQPDHEEEPSHGSDHVSMLKLLQDASLPLDMYLKQQGLTSLMFPQRVNIPAVGFQRNDGEQRVDRQSFIPSTVQKQDYVTEEQCFISNNIKTDSVSVSIQVSGQTS